MIDPSIPPSADSPPSPDSPPSAAGASSGRDPAQGWRRAAIETAQCLRFYSRLPVPALPFEADPHAVPDFATLPRVVPVAGALLGALGGAALLAGHGLGLAPLPASACAVAALAVTTGCMSEDGLADAADGFYGGATRERRLEIMRDSRVGSYGVTAIVLALLLRVAALAALAGSAGFWPAALALAASGGLSRVAGLVPLWALPPARTDGRSAAVGRPEDGAMGIAAAGAGSLALLAIGPALGPGHALLAIAAAGLAAFAGTRIARRKLGGQTGDIAGATQQAAEIAVLLVLGAGLPVFSG
jgi:adenosylcobinamide-GDP ribazoletransferase